MKKKLIKMMQKIIRWLLITLPHRIKNLKLMDLKLIKNLKFKIKNYKTPLLAGALIIVVTSLIVMRINYNKTNPYAVWEVMVVLRSQESGASPEEDAKTSLKRGDVIAVQAPGHAWSETEYKSYLLVKIEGRKQEVDRLLQPLVGTQFIASGNKEQDVIKQGAINRAPTGDSQNQQQTIRARKFAVDMDKIDFKGDQVISGQPVEGKVFRVDVIREK